MNMTSCRRFFIYRKYDLSYTKKSQSEDWDFYKSDRRGSNPRPRPWQGRTLPTEPLSHSLCCSVCFLCSLEQYILYRITRVLSTAFFNFFSKFLMQYILFHFFAHFSYMKVSNLLSFNKTNLGKSVVFYFFYCYDKQNDESYKFT